MTLQSLSRIHAISPYQPGKPITQLARELGMPVENIVKLASNENPLGASPKARAAAEAALLHAERYPDPHDLTMALAKRHGVAAGQIVLGNGSNDVLDIIARVYLDSGRSSVYSQYTFVVYPLATLSVGAEGIVAPAYNYGHDLDAMLAAIRPDTSVLWIANPNNPTGTFLPADSLRAFLAQVPDHVAVVLDEAYGEYLAPEDSYDAISWLAEFPNLIVCRTFSKIYGLAGFRIGYGVAREQVAELMNRVRQPFNCNNLALAAAEAALSDQEFVERSFILNKQGMRDVTAGFSRLGLEYIPSRGNFVTFRVNDGAAVNQRLLQAGVIVRPLAGYAMPDWSRWLRVTIGTAEENDRFLTALSGALA